MFMYIVPTDRVGMGKFIGPDTFCRGAEAATYTPNDFMPPVIFVGSHVENVVVVA